MRHDRTEEFRRCFDSHWSTVCRSLARRGAGALTEDLAAEAFSIAWRKWRRVPEEPLPWLLRTAINLLANARRRERPRVTLEESDVVSGPDGEPHSVLAGRNAAREVVTALAALSSRDREALILTAWDGLSSHEAAEVCGCSPGAFRVRLCRARAALKTLLATGEVVTR